MDTNQFIMDMAAQGGFAAFLLWLFLTTRKEQSALRKESKEEEQRIRARYDLVISDLQKEKEAARDDLKDTVSDLSARITKLEHTLIQTITRLDSIAEFKKNVS